MEGKIWIHTFPEGMCAKVNTTISTRMWTGVSQFLVPSLLKSIKPKSYKKNTRWQFKIGGRGGGEETWDRMQRFLLLRISTHCDIQHIKKKYLSDHDTIVLIIWYKYSKTLVTYNCLYCLVFRQITITV